MRVGVRESVRKGVFITFRVFKDTSSVPKYMTFQCTYLTFDIFEHLSLYNSIKDMVKICYMNSAHSQTTSLILE